MSEDARAPRTDETDATRLVPHVLGGLGVAVVLTGLVFFTTRAYRTDALTARRLAVLALLYALSAGVYALGHALERKPGLRGGYSLALLSGALAGVYYTTYAAHFVPSLQVIRSPILATVLLLGCAAATLWLSRGRSRAMALLAVLLALYAGLIGHVGSFTLVSNAVLAAAAFLFLVRNGWTGLSLAMLAVTYLTLAGWLLLGEGALAFPLFLSLGAFARAAALTTLYWALFAAPVLLSADPSFSPPRRAALLSLNTGFAVALLGLIVPRHEPRMFAVAFSLLGVLLLALAVVTRRRPGWPLLYATGGTLGLVLLAVAVISLRTGATAPLVLALAALAVAMAAEHVGSVVLRAITLLVSMLAAALACGQAGTRAGAAVLMGAVLLFTAFWVDRHDERSPRLNAGSLFFSALGLLVWLTATLSRAPAAGAPTLLAVLAVALTGAAHLVGLSPAAFLSQAFLLAAYVTFLRRADAFAGPSWAVLAIVVASLVLSAWWRTRSPRRVAGIARRVFTVVYSLGSVAVLCVWLRWRLPPGSARAWLVVPALLAAAALLYALLTEDWPVGVLGQVFLLLSVAQFWLRGMEPSRPGALVMLVPLAALVALALLVEHWRARRPATAAPAVWATPVSTLARAFACLMLVVWVCWYLPVTLQFLVLESLALVLLWWAGRRGDRFNVALSTVLSTGAVLLFWLAAANGYGSLVADLVGFTFLLAQQQLWRRRYPHLVPEALHGPAMVIGVGSLWRWATVTVSSLLGAVWVAVGWALVGLVACLLGLWLHERLYRQLGLLILLASLIRVAVVSGTDLPTMPRLISVLVIGTLLLVLGFAYDRFRPASDRVPA